MDYLRLILISILISGVIEPQNLARAQVVSEGIQPGEISVQVLIEDNAEDGCWTNIGETRRYVEDKLRERGFDVSPNGQYSFYVHVTSYRSQGLCIGAVDVELYTVVMVNGLIGFHQVGNHGGVFSKYDNANNYVLEIARELIGKI